MRLVSLIMAYYENAGMLARQYQALTELPKAMREQIEYIVVDDGSPNHPAITVPRPEGLPKLSIYRVGVDVRWNQDAARNIGVHHAAHDWLLLTDMDHLVPRLTWATVLYSKLSGKRAYRFGRVSAPDNTPYKLHPNSWLMTRTLFNQMGGYDERFAGWYGTDGEFRERLLQYAPIDQLPDVLIRVPREVIPDASTTTYERKSPEDKAAVRKIWMQRNSQPGWKTLRLSFPYERAI